MASPPVDRNFGGSRNSGGYWDARDEERLRRAQADFDYQGEGRWDEQLGGYREIRRDERIREDVSIALADDPYLDASAIQVKVENGEVTLDGTVRTLACRRRARMLAKVIAGVVHVQNNLRVESAAQQQAAAADQMDAIKSDVAGKLS